MPDRSSTGLARLVVITERAYVRFSPRMQGQETHAGLHDWERVRLRLRHHRRLHRATFLAFSVLKGRKSRQEAWNSYELALGNDFLHPVVYAV